MAQHMLPNLITQIQPLEATQGRENQLPKRFSDLNIRAYTHTNILEGEGLEIGRGKWISVWLPATQS